jgi:hypothetical protein
LILQCAGAPHEEEDVWYVVAECITDQRSTMDTVEIAEDLWQKAEEFMHQAGTRMAVGHVGTADDLCMLGKLWTSLQNDIGAQNFTHIHLSARHLVPMWSWIQCYQDQAQADT